MTDSNAELLTRIEQCEMELQALRGYVKALEAGLHTVIATVDTPRDLATLWQHVLAEAPEHPAPGSTELYHAAFRAGLATLSSLIAGAVARKEDT